MELCRVVTVYLESLDTRLNGVTEPTRLATMRRVSALSTETGYMGMVRALLVAIPSGTLRHTDLPGFGIAGSRVFKTNR
jgi:hypothetical protein